MSATTETGAAPGGRASGPTSEVGVVIATRDRREDVTQTLGKLRALPERPPVVLVDNGSADGTAEAAERHPGVTVIRLRRNVGAAARTEGVRALDTPIVAFSDDDSWWEPGALKTAAGLFDRHPRLGLIAARILVGPDGSLDPTCLEMRDSPLPPEPDLPGPAVLGFVACGAIVRRSALLEVGGFHPRLGLGGEERLLALDLAAAGWGLAYVDWVVARHHPAAAGQERPGRRRALLRNELWTAWLRRPLRPAAARTAAIAIQSVRARAPLTPLRAAAGLPWILRERRVVPPRVEQAVRAIEMSP